MIEIALSINWLEDNQATTGTILKLVVDNLKNSVKLTTH